MRLMLAAFVAGMVGFSSVNALAGGDPPQGDQPVTRKATPTAPANAAQPAQAQPEGDALPPPPPKVPIPDLPVISRQELEGGLIIEDMKIGTGYEVKPGGAVVAYYHGTLKDNGKEFDSAFRKGEPVAFALTSLVEGWQKGIPGMKVGGIRRLIIPAKMGWGERGAGPSIPPNSDVVFIIQLEGALEIVDEKVGTGEEVSGQCVAVTTHEIKDQSGKVIETADASSPYIWIPAEWQPMQYGLEGMKVGGKRKLVVPAQMNKGNPQANATRVSDVPVTIEFELVALRNLGPKKAKTTPEQTGK